MYALKYILLLFVLLLPPCNLSHQKQISDKDQENAKPVPSSSSVQTVTPQHSASAEEKNLPQKSAEQMPPWWDVTWATWALVILALTASVVAYLTFRGVEQQVQEMRESGKQMQKLIEHAESQVAAITKSVAATQNTANAALLNAQAIINAQRAWISVKLRRYAEEAFTLSIHNHGRTPGEITLVKHLDKYVPTISDFEPDSNYEEIAEQLYRKIIVPGEIWEAGGFWDDNLRLIMPDELYKEVKSSRQRYFIYGVVEYKDTVIGDLHETRFCFWYNPHYDTFEIGGPRSMTKST